MKHPHIRTGRSLAGMVLILFGLSAYGCGDSATVTEPATLGGLSASAGLLEPKFNPATTNYTVKLFGNESSTTITASPRVAGDTIRINNQQTSSQTVTIASIGASELLSIVVTETGTGGTSRSYSVRVSREEEDTTLRDLSSSDGTLAPSPFVKAELAPSINGVGNGVTSITLTATKSDPNTVMVIDVATAPVTVPAGIASGEATVQLGGPGSDTKVPIIITGPKGGKTTYTVTIKRGASDNAFLGSLSITGGRLTFNPGRNDTPYEVSVPSGTDKVTVTGKPQDANASMAILVNGAEVPQPISLLGPGQTTSITVRVIAQDGKSQQNYVIRVIRDALGGNNNLSALTISPGSLDFRSDTLTYTVNVGSTVPSVNVSATKADRNATMSQDVTAQAGTATGRATISLVSGAGSTTPILITVTAPNGTSKTYRINVVKDALGGNNNLSALTISPGSLDFRSDTLTYTVNVGSTVPSVNVSATKADRNATMSQDVTAQAGTATGQASISLGLPGSTTPILITVTAPNGTPKTYRINVVRNALGGNNNLSALTVTPADSFTPALNNTTTEYEANVGSTVGSVTVKASKADVNAVMSGDVTAGAGTRTNEATIQLGAPGPVPTVVRIRVTAPNGVPKDYRIEVFKALPSSNANLSALRVTAGSSVTNFSSPFASNTVTVAPEIGEVVVRATKDDTNATMAIGGVTVPPGTKSGQTTFTLNGAGGDPTTISFTVTAPDGITVKTYTISVIRPAAPTPPAPPTSAPDLITADDSCQLIPGTSTCFPPTSDTDNKTNVKRPGFSVPAPGSGETAKLYMKKTTGEEFPSSSTSAGNTLIFRPNADLPDGLYDVTYTLSNSVGESDKSPVMAPQLEINTIINN